MRVTSPIQILAIGFALCGCATDGLDNHVLKLDRPYNHIINDPCEWALRQFSDGPISGPEVDDYARLVLSYGLRQALADLDGDGTQELLLRQDSPDRVWEVLVFTPVKGGYRYLGHLAAGMIMPFSDGRSVLVYEPCGGHYGFIKAYRRDGQRFVCYVTEDIIIGDGAPEENNRKLEELFPEEELIKWEKTRDNPDAMYPAIRLRFRSVDHWRGVSGPFPSA